MLIIRLIGIAAYYYIWKSKVNEKMLIEKNKYEMNRLNENSDSISDDNLD
jgi:hypothetical protein